MADLLTSVSKELAARLDELRPLVEEHARLERALAALDGAGARHGRARRTAGRTRASSGGSGMDASRASPARRRRRAPRGANREATLTALRDHDGPMSVPELAAATGIEKPTLYALTRTLLEQRALTGKTEQGRRVFTLAG